MSRHNIQKEKHDKLYDVSYGYDRPLSEYFIQVFEPGKEEPVFAVASYLTMEPHPHHPDKVSWTNGELLELFEEWGVPKEHCQLLAMDQPIP